MRAPVPPPRTPGSLFAGGERKRFAFLVVCLLLVAGTLLASLYQGKKGVTHVETRTIEDESALEPAAVAVPALDVESLQRLVHDADPADRVVLESEAADRMVEAARRYTPRHFQRLGAPELDAARIAEIDANPSAVRGKPFVARGRLVALRRRTGVVAETQWLGTLELPDESAVHFLTLELPPGAETVGGTMRLDGLFLKRFKVEDALQAGLWLEGPLLVGPRLVRSFPALGPVTQLEGGPFLEVEDARLSPEEGEEPSFVMEPPAEALWYLMAFAHDAGEDAIDWDAAPVLDRRLLDRLVEEPEVWRAQPIRIPISRLQDGRVKLAGENPARLERYTEGWIGNNTWRNVIRFRTPVLRPDLHVGDLVVGRGFFLHAFAYESSEHGLRIAPMFVLQSLDRFHPETSPTLQRIPWVIAGIGIVLTVLFVVLTRRDSKQTSQLYQELVQRRRARRGRPPVDTEPTTR